MAEIEGYKKIIDGVRAAIAQFEKKIHDTINRVWAE